MVPTITVDSRPFAVSSFDFIREQPAVTIQSIQRAIITLRNFDGMPFCKVFKVDFNDFKI